MADERLRDVLRVYEAALAREGADRAAYLDAECGADATLRQEVEALLAAPSTDPGQFLSTPPLQGQPPPLPPPQIGPYRILGVLGEGGMGVVYLAEQAPPLRRQVAVKIVKIGMDARDVLARFDLERQALALMDHPGIATVLDSGATSDGRPYFVMEYVAGVPITDYCDRHRLRNAERLGIFVHVCAAVQHAHQKGVIHRDLKPSNILVTVQDGKPVPKVIDFGIAKATHRIAAERAAFTSLGMLVGTPEYISPEQAEANALEVDTTTDIYSLGVVLYELLTGVLPFDGETLRRAGYAEMQRIIREQDPPQPSARVTALGATAAEVARRHQATAPALRKQLQGDLDAIAMKALEKDRTRRYASASEFAADITRYVNGEAVVARPPSVVYRTRKFVRRHRLGVAAALVVVLALSAGLVVSTRLYVQVRAERQAANHQSYLANVAAADAHVRAAEGNDARRRLLAAPVALRNWEWRYLWASSIPVAAILPAGNVLAVSGRSIFIAREARLEEWDRVTFKRTASHPLPGEALAADTKGRRVVVRSTTGNDRSYAVFDVAAGQTLSRPALGDDRYPQFDPHPRFAPDGSHFVTQRGGDDGAVIWWDADTGRALATRAVPGGRVIGFTPDSRQVFTRKRSSISLWTPESGQEHDVVTFGPGVSVYAAAVTPDGTRVITAGSDGVLKEWNVRTRLATRTYGKRARVFELAISGDGRFLAVESWGLIEIWDCATATMLIELKGSTGVQLFPPVFSSDGQQVFARARYGGVCVWDIRRAHLAAGVTFPDTTYVVPSADGRHVLARRKSGALERWDLDTLTMEPVAVGGHAIGTVTISDDGQRVAAATKDGELLAWTDVASPPLVIGRGKGSVNSIAFSRNGARVAAVWGEFSTGESFSGPPNRLRAWDISAGRQLIDVAVDPAKVAFDGAGRRVLVAGGSWAQSLERNRDEEMARFEGPPCNSDTLDTVQVWDLDSGRKMMGVRKECAHAAVFTSDDAFVVSDSWDAPVVMYAVDGGRIARRSAEMPVVMSLAVSPDGSRIAVGTGESQIVILDARSLETLLVIRPASQATTTVKFSANGAQLIATGIGSIVRVYDTTPPHEPAAVAKAGRQ